MISPIVPAKTKRIKPLFASAVLLWLLLALLALGWIEKTDTVAGTAAHPPAQFQKLGTLTFDAAKPTLIMLVHPQCPCSRASLTELNRLAALCPGKAAIFVLLLRPTGCPEAFADTDLRRQASAIPGVSVKTDENGRWAERFGAATSGETLLYAPNGRLLYHGGLTGSRGHEGDNAGLSAVVAHLRGETGPTEAPVYGCPMTADRTRCKISRSISWLP